MAKEYKEGVDFEWVSAKDSKGNVVKDGKGNPVKTRRFFTKAEKEAKKAKPKTQNAPTQTKKPAKTAEKASSPRPQARPTQAKKAGGARPEGPAAGMPKSKKDEAVKNARAVVAAGAIGAALAAKARGKSAPSTPKKPSAAYNPKYTGKAKMQEGFRGKMGGAGRVIGLTSPAKMGARLAGGSRNALDMTKNNPYRLE